VRAKEGRNVRLISGYWKRLFETHIHTSKLVSIRILERCGLRGVVDSSEPTDEDLAWEARWVWV
jgi:hypothetical protein